MADDKKKTKIDLKARLGKTTQVGLGGAMPMPLPVPGGTPPPPPSSDRGADSAPLPSSTPAVGSVRPPPNIAPPVGLSPGIPLPPFAQQPRPQQRAEPKQSAAQQTIKIEMGEEVAQEQKKMRARAAVYAVLAALVGAGLGFVAGGSKEHGDALTKAAHGAELLEKDVKTANDKLRELDSKLSDAGDKMKNKSFPDDLPTALAAMKIPFDSTNLDGKGTGSLSPRVFRLLSDYTRSVDAVDKLRETLKNAATLAKDPLTKAWKEETTPMTGFSVLFRNEGGKGIVAEVVTNKEPFPWKGDFKKEYTVTTGGARPQDKNASRWEKGDPGGTIVPLDPSSMKPFLNDPNVGRFVKALVDIKAELDGNHDNPTNEIPGLLKMGDDLAQELHKASLNK